MPLAKVFRLFLLAMSFSLLGADADAANKWALVIGNDVYVNLGPRNQLQKARNDATAMKRALEKAGFSVMLGLDQKRGDINWKLQQLANQIQPGDVVAFFFAGHGVEIGGTNYLLPSDIPAVKSGQETYLRAEAINFNDVLELVQYNGARVGLFVLDACRDNPFTDDTGRSLGGRRGLSRVNPPEGTLILYSAAAGQTALDRLGNNDPDPNSVFTRSLLPLISDPDLELTSLTKQLRQRVVSLARSVGHDQRPAVYNEIIGDFCLSGNCRAGAQSPSFQGAPGQQSPGQQPPGQQPSAEAPATQPSQNDAAAVHQAWMAVKDSDNTDELELFIEMFGEQNAYYRALAGKRLEFLQQQRQSTPQPQPDRATQTRTGDVCFDLWYERNAIFDRKGYCFKTAKGRKYFDNADCWTSNPSLTPAELRRVDELKRLEAANGC